MRQRHLALAGVLLIAIGCQKPVRVAMKNEHRNSVQSSETLIGETSQEIGISINQANGGMGFGLIGALIDSAVNSSRAKDAEALVVPVRNALVGYDPHIALQAGLKQELPKIDWLNCKSVEVRQVKGNDLLVDFVKASGQDDLLYLNMDYRFSPDFASISVILNVQLRPKNEKAPAGVTLDAQSHPILYANNLYEQYSMPGMTDPKMKPEDLVKLWSEDGGKKVKDVLDAAMSELPAMIAFDLMEPGTVSDAMYDPPQGAEVVQSSSLSSLPLMNGYVVKKFEARRWVRFSGGQLCSMPR